MMPRASKLGASHPPHGHWRQPTGGISPLSTLPSVRHGRSGSPGANLISGRNAIAGRRGERVLGIGLGDLRDNRRSDSVKVACVEEYRPMPQLRRAVAARSRTASPTSQEIDVTLSGEIEAVFVPADERAGRRG